MTNRVHILGNGDMSSLMPNRTRHGHEGKVITCNQPQFPVASYATAIVDFKMMKALHKREVNLDSFMWVCGNRPKIYCDSNPSFYMTHAERIREFYTDVPKYCGPNAATAATNFNCGHFATHYACRRHKPDEVNLYGFDSLFDHNMNSFTDLVLPSDRGDTNNHRLLGTWRPIWAHIFNEFKDIKFRLWHTHDNTKVPFPSNVEIVVVDKKSKVK